MEKKYYGFTDFFEWYMRNATVQYGTEAEIYKLDGKVYKIFNSSYGERNEESIEIIGKMDPRYLTIPIYLIYLGLEYYGFVMDDAGDDLKTILNTQDLSFDKKYDILSQLKEGLLYIEDMGTPHGDLSISNILYDSERVRIGDVNNLIIGNSSAHLNYCGRSWFRAFGSYKTVDRLAFNLLTYLLLNFSTYDIRELIQYERKDPDVFRKRVIDQPNEVFKPEIWTGYEQELLRGNKLVLENKTIDKDIFLIDYLR